MPFWDKRGSIRVCSSDVIIYYNQRSASERNYDCQNNDFGWRT